MHVEQLLRSDFWGCLSTFLTEPPGQLLAASPFQLGAGLRQELSHPVLSLPNKAVSGGNSCRSLHLLGPEPTPVFLSLPGPEATSATPGRQFPPCSPLPGTHSRHDPLSLQLIQLPCYSRGSRSSAPPSQHHGIRILPAGLYKCRVSSLKTTQTLLILTPASSYPLFTS